MPTLPVLQGFLPHHHSSWKLHPPSCPLPTHSHRPSRSSSLLGRIPVLPYYCRPFHALAGSLPHPRHHSRKCHVPSFLAGYQAFVVHGPSPLTKDANSSHTCSTTWQRCVALISAGKLPTTLQPMALWNGYIAR